MKKRKVTKGVVLAGGTGSRLWPHTVSVQKHALPVGPVPMAALPILSMVEAGIEDIIVVSGSESMGSLVSQFKDGQEYGANLTYKCQRQAGGIAEALGICEDVIEPDEHFVVILGDNIFQDSLIGHVKNYESKIRKNGSDCIQLLLKKVSDPSRYGVPNIEGNTVVGIEEKPENPKSEYAVTGLYFYPGSIFQNIETLDYSERGELEITDLNNLYIPGNCYFSSLEGFWTDAGTHKSYRRANMLVWKYLEDISYLSPVVGKLRERGLI